MAGTNPDTPASEQIDFKLIERAFGQSFPGKSAEQTPAAGGIAL
jgi:hypothetical protein